jgi:hypothetical protein
MDFKKLIGPAAGAACLLALAACSSPPTAPVATDVAAPRNAAASTVGARAGAPASDEITSARTRMQQANQALQAKDYQRARELAVRAEADARLAQSKANSADTSAASNALNEDLRVLRQEVDRAGSQQ